MTLFLGSVQGAEDRSDPVVQALHSPTATALRSIGARPADVMLWPVQENDELTPQQQAARWFKLVDTAAQGETLQAPTGCQQDPLERPGLCLRWRKSDALSEFRARYQETSKGMKSRFFGEKLADHLEIDIDSSPEIKLKWEFD